MIHDRNINKKAAINSVSSLTTNSKTATLVSLKHVLVYPERSQKQHQLGGQFSGHRYYSFYVQSLQFWKDKLNQEKREKLTTLVKVFMYNKTLCPRKLAHMTTLSHSHSSTIFFRWKKKDSDFLT